MPPEKVLLESRAITSEQLSRGIADRYGLDHVDLDIYNIDMGAANLLSASAARRYGAVPVAYIDENTLLLAMSDPANVLAVDGIALLTRMDVKLVYSIIAEAAERGASDIHFEPQPDPSSRGATSCGSGCGSTAS